MALANALPDVLNASVGELNFKNVVNKLGDVMYTFPFSLPPYYIAIIRCLGVLEGVAIQVPHVWVVSGSLSLVRCRRQLLNKRHQFRSLAKGMVGGTLEMVV